MSRKYEKGATNCRSKKYVLTFPDGNVFVVHGLRNFCKNFTIEKLYVEYLNAVANGKKNQYKGYKCRHYDEELDKNIRYYDGDADVKNQNSY